MTTASGVAQCLVSTFGRPSARLNLAEVLEGYTFYANMSQDRHVLAVASIRKGQKELDMDFIRFDEKGRERAQRHSFVNCEGDDLINAFDAVAPDPGLTFSLRTLTITRVELGRSWSEWIGTGLARNPPLECLTLEACGLGDVEVTAIARRLDQNTTLKSLSLRGNAFGHDAFIVLIEHVPSSLLELDLQSNYFYTRTSTLAMGRWLRSNPVLQVLDLTETNLSLQAVQFLVRSVNGYNSNLKVFKCEWLEVLAMPLGAVHSTSIGNHLRLTDREDLDWDRVWAANPQLKQIEVVRWLNAMQGLLSGATFSSLSALGLYDCQIGNNGLRALLDALSGNKTLTSLDLGRCQIGDVGGCLFWRRSAPVLSSIGSGH
jgi:Ran GTPase-activating protein (RanGAP) involved in mRNA processing and transport